ncbi:hypothetical protein AAY473_029979 [Plecturocebus cupreus]
MAGGLQDLYVIVMVSRGWRPGSLENQKQANRAVPSSGRPQGSMQAAPEPSSRTQTLAFRAGALSREPASSSHPQALRGSLPSPGRGAALRFSTTSSCHHFS